MAPCTNCHRSFSQNWSDFNRHRQINMTPEKLARRTELPTTTVHRIMFELVRRGTLERGMLERGTAGLQLSTLVFELGQFTPHIKTLRETARPVLMDLSHATSLNVGLAVLDGTEVVYLDIYAGPDAPGLPQSGGMR